MVEVHYEAGLELRLADGVVLRSDVWRPAGPGRYPTLLIRQPYGRRQAEDITYAHPAWYARHGFAVVSQDTRGRWDSDGEFVPFGTEGPDGAETLEWAAGLPFSDGNVGMYGFSYGGFTQLQAAAHSRSSALKAMVPALTSADVYEGWAYQNGAFSLAFNASWSTMLASDIARRHGESALELELMGQFLGSPGLYGILPLSDYPNLGPGQLGRFFQDWLAHETKDAYWQQWDVTDRLDSMEAAALVVGGLYDIFLESTIGVYDRLSSRAGRATSLVLAPWSHIPWDRQVGATDFGEHARNHVDELQLAFFSHVLRGDDAPDTAPVTAFVTGRNEWTTFESWPPDHDGVRLFLHGSRANSRNGDGALSTEPPGREPCDTFTYDPGSPVPSIGGRSCCFSGVAPMGRAEQGIVESNNGVLVYTSQPLERDMLVAGPIEATIWAATTAADTDWVVRVCDVDEYGLSFNIAETIQRARFHQGTDESRPVPRNEVTRFALRTSCCHEFRAGHRIRLHVTSSAFPAWDRNLNTGNPVGSEPISAREVAIQTVFHDEDAPSAIRLPVIS